MPSPNGFFDCGNFTGLSRDAFRARVTHDNANPPWDNANFTYTWEVNYGTSATGPFTPAPLADIPTGCTAEPDNESAPGSGETVVAIGAGGVTEGTDYWVEWILRDQNGLEVDRDVCGPHPVPPKPAALTCLATTPTDTSASPTVGVTDDGEFNTDIASCDPDTMVWEIATTAGGPYTAEPSEPIFTPGSASHTFTGLTPSTTYFVRARFSDDGGTEYLVGPECSFTTQAAAGAFNPECFIPTDGEPIQANQARLGARADNVPADHTITIEVTAVSGDYNGPVCQSAPPTPGNNTAGQTFQNTSWTGSCPLIQPGATLFFRTVVRDAGNAIVDTSDECTFTLRDEPAFLSCGNSVEEGYDQALFVYNTDEEPVQGSAIWGLDISTAGATGPWIPTGSSSDGCVNDQAVPYSLALPSGGFRITDLQPDTDYWVRITLDPDDPDAGASQQLVCGPVRTRDLSDYLCGAPSDVTTTSARLNFNRQAVGQNGGIPHIKGDSGCPDVFTVRWGTVAGGPYPNSDTWSATDVASHGGTAAPFSDATGLTPDTDYFYVLELADSDGVVYETSPECMFRTQAETPPPGGFVPVFTPVPCDDDDGGGDPTPVASRRDVEGTLLCDVDAQGDVVGSAIIEAVYDDETGNRVGTRTVNPTDGTTYTPVGTLQPCPGEEAEPVAPVVLRARSIIASTQAPWTPAQVTGTLVALSATGMQGQWGVEDPEGALVQPIPSGATLSWGAEDRDSLDPPVRITPTTPTGTVLVSWTEREA